MDGISVAASFIAIVQITVSIASTLKDYYEGVRDARDDINKLYKSMKSFESLLDSIRRTLDDYQDDKLVIDQIKTDLESLKLKLDGSEVNKSRTRTSNTIRSLKWPMKKKDVETVIGLIEKHKSSLQLGLGVRNLNLQLKNFDIQEEIRKEIRESRNDTNRRHIIEWLSRGLTDPSVQHNIAREKHEETTGAWLIDGDPFQTWAVTPNSFTWLHGSAGAGKSILCSTAIDHTQKQQSSTLGVVVAYWYFTFTDNETQNVFNLICSLITDISSNRRQVHPALQEAYDKSNFGQQKPSLQGVKLILHEIIASMTTVFVFLDALDECPKAGGSREKLLDTLRDIHNWGLPQLHVMATSRREIDIQEFFHNNFDKSSGYRSIGIQGSHVEADVKKYINHALQGFAYRKWCSDLKEEVGNTLALQAGGMFRLVALQLDALRQIRIESRIRAALHQLPSTLDAFYDRVLLDINEIDQAQAHLALKWLAYTPRLLSVKELAEAVVITNEKPYFNKDDRFMDYRDVLQMLPSGLVSTTKVKRNYLDTIVNYDRFSDLDFKPSNDHFSCSSNDDGSSDSGDMDDESDQEVNDKSEKLMIQLAHYSVKEYLVSSRIAHGPAALFQVNEVQAHDLIAKSSISYMISVAEYHNAPFRTREFSVSPLIHYATHCWTYHLLIAETTTHNVDRDSLLLQFLIYASKAWRLWGTLTYRDDIHNDSDFIFDMPFSLRSLDNRAQDHIHPITWVSGAGLENTLVLLLQTKPVVDQLPRSQDLSPLYYASMMGNLKCVQHLVNNGADVSFDGWEHGSPLSVAVQNNELDVIRYLLEHGAASNKRSMESALTTAVSNNRRTAVNLLLDTGLGQNDIRGALQLAIILDKLDIVILFSRLIQRDHSRTNWEFALFQAATEGDTLSIDEICKRIRAFKQWTQYCEQELFWEAVESIAVEKGQSFVEQFLIKQKELQKRHILIESTNVRINRRRISL